MKKIIFFAAGILITSLAFYSCSVFRSLQEVENNGFICSNYNFAPVNTMDKQVVLSMIRNYYKNQYRAINSSNANSQPLVQFPSSPGVNVDSRVVFFNLDTLKRLIYYMDKATKQFSLQDRQNLGVNVYFASYPDQMQMQIGGYDYTNRHTLVFMPSIFDNTNHIARDFDLNNSLKAINLFSPLYLDSSFFNNPGITSIPAMGVYKTANTVTSGSMNSQNHGTGTPPPPEPNDNIILAITH